MNILFRPILFMALVLSPSGVLAQAEGLSSLSALVARNPKVALYRGDFHATITSDLDATSSCSFTLTTGMATSGRTSTESHTVDLRKYSPTPTVVKWDDAEIWSVRIYTASGRDETPIVRNNVDEGRKGNLVELVFGSEPPARRAATALKSAIIACGGKRTGAAVTAAEKQGALDPQGLRMLPECKRMVSAMLKLPSSAEFPPARSLTFLRDEDKGTLSILGDVEGANSLGGRIKKHFACTFEKAGDAWVPNGRPLIY